MIIRKSISALALAKASQLKQQTASRKRQYVRNNHNSRKSTTLAAYAGTFLFIITIVAIGYQAPQQGPVDSVANARSTAPDLSPVSDTPPSVDQLIATRVAANIAERAQLPIARNIAEEAISLSVKSELAHTESSVISKPQIIQPSAGSREIRTHMTTAGDTVPTLAAQYGVSVDTIKWANNLTSDALEPDRSLQIPPINGIIYTVKDGDTPTSIAERYSADERRLVAYNDLELGGLTAGRKIILPDGDLPATERPGYTAPRPQTSVAFSPVRYGAGFGGSSTWTIGYGTSPNRYAAGNCTAYAFNRRVQLGKPVGEFWGNAASWAHFASRSGLAVNNTPSVGAIIQNGGGYGHVGVVEEIMPNGDISISEMNAFVPGGGFNIVSGRVIPAGNVGSYNYIH